MRVDESVVVRGGALHQLEDLTLRPEPLKDVRVIGAGSALGELVAGCFHIAQHNYLIGIGQRPT